MRLASCDSGTVLLTGATGVLGAHLLKELLRTTDSDVLCLVRGDTIDGGRRRLADLLAAYDPERTLAAEFMARVTPILGDVTEPQLGLDESAYAELAGRVDLVLHSAASTNLFARFGKIEPVNVGGTREVVKLALATRAKRFCYVSTYTVVGDKQWDPSMTFSEDDLDVGQGFKHLSYQETKFIAEKLVRAAGAEGLNWLIVRPGQIFGESTTGRYPQGLTNVSGLFYDIFKTVIETGVAMSSDFAFDITPVDYVSTAMLHLARDPSAYGKAWHLVNPNPSPYTRTVGVIADLGFSIRFVSPDEYKHMLFNKGLQVEGAEYKSYTTKALKWWYLSRDFDFGSSCRIECETTARLLESRGIRCPRIDHELLGVYVDSGVREGYFPQPLVRRAAAAGAR